MSLPTSPSNHFSLDRPSRLLLDESSLGEAQKKLQLHSNRMHTYMSEAHGDASKNHHEAENRTPYYVENAEAQGSPANSAFCHQVETELEPGENIIESTVARILHDGSYGYSSCTGRSFNDTLEAWKPPKPAKPFFLCSPMTFQFDDLSSDPENFQHVRQISSGREKSEGEIGQPIHGPNPLSPSTPKTPFSTPLSINKATRSGIVHPLKCQQARSPIPARESIWCQPLMPTSPCSPKQLPYKLPIGDPKRPFPHPIPTLDRLPVRAEDEGCSQSEKEKGKAKSVEPNKGVFSYPKEAFLGWIKTMSFALISFTIYGPISEREAEPLPSKRNSYVFCVKTMWSTFDDISTYSKEHGKENIPQVPKEEPASLLQINIIMPALLLQTVTLNGFTVRDIRVSTVLSMMARKLKTLFMLVTIFILLALDAIRYNLVSRGGRRTAR